MTPDSTTIFGRIKSWIGSMGYELFLWSLGMTNNEFIDEVIKTENARSNETQME